MNVPGIIIQNADMAKSRVNKAGIIQNEVRSLTG
jgi:hypothetical protein